MLVRTILNIMVDQLTEIIEYEKLGIGFGFLMRCLFSPKSFNQWRRSEVMGVEESE